MVDIAAEFALISDILAKIASVFAFMLSKLSELALEAVLIPDALTEIATEFALMLVILLAMLSEFIPMLAMRF